MKKRLAVFVFAGILSLAGCSTPKVSDKHAAAAASHVAYDKMSKQQQLAARLESAGVTVVSKGQTLHLIIPVDQFFIAQNRSQLKANKVGALKDITRLVGHYSQNAPIHVTGFTSSDIGSVSDQKKVSKAWAEAIASYLWNQGVDKNRMTIRGVGAKQSIATNLTPEGSAYNRRVEVSILLPR